MDGLASAFFGAAINLPTAALAYAILRQARVVSDVPAASH
jgi:hypothetical protein